MEVTMLTDCLGNEVIPFEDEYPEEAQILAELCQERAKTKARGKRIKPIYTDCEGESLYLEPIRVEAKCGRNDPCSCESGKKFKKCCGR
jgi:uncharacterized protein YchJ